MRYSTKVVCFLAVLLLTLSVASVATAKPTEIVADPSAMAKLEPRLRDEVRGLLKTSPNAELNTIVFLAKGSEFANAKDAMTISGALVSAQYPALGAVAATVSAESLLGVALLDQVEKVFLDGKKEAIPVPQGDWIGDITKIYDPATGIWYASTPYTMGADRVWDEGITGEGVKVAVLDTGADISQNDIAGAIYDYKSFTSEPFRDGDGHGTSCSGLIASRAVNTYYGFIKIQGMAPESMIMAGKVLTDEGWGWDSWIVAGVEWAVAGSDGDPGTPEDGAQIISMSLGGLEVPNDGNDPLSLALDRAAERGVASFVASGNEGSGSGTVSSPGVSESTITVGASTNNAEAFGLLGYWPFTKFNGKYYASDYENNHMIYFSSSGPTADGRIDPDVAAVGAWGPAPAPGNSAELQFGGTSMSTPVAAGIGALVYEAFMKTNERPPTPAEIKAILMGTAMDMGYRPTEQGAGRVDAWKAYEAATGAVEVGEESSIELTLSPGEKEEISLDADEMTSRTLERISGAGFKTSGSVKLNKDWFYPFQIPEGVDYAQIDLSFDPRYVYPPDPHHFDGTWWTDDHLNMVLYKIEAGGRTMVNYAYAHTNSQELSARVTPGTYELRVWGAQYVHKWIPFSVKADYYVNSEWSWASIDDSTVTIKVPKHAQAGAHTAYLEVTRGELTSLVPVVVTVPMTVGLPVKGVIDVGQRWPYAGSGDWAYYAVSVPSGSEALTAVLAWEEWNTAIDVYLINPEGDVAADSTTPYLGGGLYGPWMTSTGITAQVVSVLAPAEGSWMIVLHDTFLGNVFAEEYMLVATLEAPAGFVEDEVTVDGSEEALLKNDLPLPMQIGLTPVMSETEAMTETYEGTVVSISLGGTGYSEHVFEIAPGTESFELSASWEEDAPVVVSLYDAVSNRGVIQDSGDKITINDPAPGWWWAEVMVKEPDCTVDYSLSLVRTVHPAWDDLMVEPVGLTLMPMDWVIVTLTAAPDPTTTSGMVMVYDLVTGCVYDWLEVTLVES